MKKIACLAIALLSACAPEPCQVEETNRGALITCPDGSEALVEDGEDGQDGQIQGFCQLLAGACTYEAFLLCELRNCPSDREAVCVEGPEMEAACKVVFQGLERQAAAGETCADVSLRLEAAVDEQCGD